MDVHLLDEMSRVDGPVSPGTYKQQADDRMWAELADENPELDEDENRSNKGEKLKCPSRNGKSRSRPIPHFRSSFPRENNGTSFHWTTDRTTTTIPLPRSGVPDDVDDYLSFNETPKNGDPTLEPLRIPDLDVFFTQVYTYFKERGLACMITQRLVNLTNLAFTIVFSTFLFLFVDWSSLATCAESEGGCTNFSSYVDWTLESGEGFSFWTGVVVFYFVTFCIFWIWTFISFFPVIKFVCLSSPNRFVCLTHGLPSIVVDLV